MDDAAYLARMPALAAYVERIGAEQKNFRKYVIPATDEPMYGHTRRGIATIWLQADGTVQCAKEEFAPTEDEAVLIASQFAAAGLPTSIKANSIQVAALRAQLRAKYDADPMLFVFKTLGVDDVLFVQQRIRTTDGGKNDLPWSYWSDAVWRNMEPDDALPLCGLEQPLHKPVMLHEGAKTALVVRAMLEDPAALAAHPWGAELQHYVHLGWPGGAQNPHLVDWEPIKNLPRHVSVCMVCDNDQPGKQAATIISRMLKRPFKALHFDDRFPAAFDLAEPWPKRADWWHGKRYIGPQLDNLLRPATWATKVVPSTRKNGKPHIEVLREFANEWVVVTQPAVFVHRDKTDVLLDAKGFNSKVAPFSDAPDTAKLLEKYHSSTAEGLAYIPHERGGIVGGAEEGVFNTYRPPRIKACAGDPQPWLDFLAHLFPVAAERLVIMRWCATLIMRPDIKMHYGLLLISHRHGVGKGTLAADILAPLVGMWNTSSPNNKTIADGTFNSWVAHKRLAVVHEIYSGHSENTYNTLKTYITERKVTVHRKYIEEYQIDNYVHVIACSNNDYALYLDDEDRRWYAPELTDVVKPQEYWRDLQQWLRVDGLGIIRRWAENFLKQEQPVATGEWPPKSATKDEIVAASRGPGRQLCYDIVEQLQHWVADQIAAGGTGECVLGVHDVRAWVALQRSMDLGNSKLESPKLLRGALMGAGLKSPKKRFKIEGVLTNVVANFVIPEDAGLASFSGRYKKVPALWPLEAAPAANGARRAAQEPEEYL